MQTIKVTVTTQGDKTTFAIDGKQIAEIEQDSNHSGKFCYSIHLLSGNNNLSRASALKAVRNKIHAYLGAWGINVEFV